jgi:hypothetical protein
VRFFSWYGGSGPWARPFECGPRRFNTKAKAAAKCVLTLVVTSRSYARFL